jgi:shikimate dehydrogenase
MFYMSDLAPCAGVVGWPVEHSRSPMIHRFWLKKYGISGSYNLYPVEPEEVSQFFAKLPISGANITIPYKEIAFRCVNETDELARRLGAVNTIYTRDGKTIGTNTDGYGFLAHLKASAPHWGVASGPVVLLGAGGATRAIAGALIDEGVRTIKITNRTRHRAEELARELGDNITIYDWEKRAEILDDASLLVNTTSLGMKGNPDLDISLAQMQEGSIVYDIVYNPLETNLLRAARARALKGVDGLGMLLHQAVPGFELWFGRRPEVTAELRDLVVASLVKI